MTINKHKNITIHVHSRLSELVFHAQVVRRTLFAALEWPTEFSECALKKCHVALEPVKFSVQIHPNHPPHPIKFSVQLQHPPKRQVVHSMRMRTECTTMVVHSVRMRIECTTRRFGAWSWAGWSVVVVGGGIGMNLNAEFDCCRPESHSKQQVSSPSFRFQCCELTSTFQNSKILAWGMVRCGEVR